MMNNDRGWWWWTRGVMAVLLAALLVAFALPSAGRMVVDAATSPPTYRAVWGFWECFSAVGPAAISLACIFVSMWRRWDSEIIGWVLLVVLILGVVLGGTGARLGRPFRALGGVGAGPGAMPRAGLGRPVGAEGRQGTRNSVPPSPFDGEGGVGSGDAGAELAVGDALIVLAVEADAVDDVAGIQRTEAEGLARGGIGWNGGQVGRDEVGE